MAKTCTISQVTSAPTDSESSTIIIWTQSKLLISYCFCPHRSLLIRFKLYTFMMTGTETGHLRAKSFNDFFMCPTQHHMGLVLILIKEET